MKTPLLAAGVGVAVLVAGAALVARRGASDPLPPVQASAAGLSPATVDAPDIQTPRLIVYKSPT